MLEIVLFVEETHQISVKSVTVAFIDIIWMENVIHNVQSVLSKRSILMENQYVSHVMSLV